MICGRRRRRRGKRSSLSHTHCKDPRVIMEVVKPARGGGGGDEFLQSIVFPGVVVVAAAAVVGPPPSGLFRTRNRDTFGGGSHINPEILCSAVPGS